MSLKDVHSILNHRLLLPFLCSPKVMVLLSPSFSCMVTRKQLQLDYDYYTNTVYVYTVQATPTLALPRPYTYPRVSSGVSLPTYCP